MRRICRESAIADEARGDPGPGGARAPPGKPQHPEGCGSCLLRRGNAVDPAALLLRRSESEPELLLQSAGEEAPDRVPLPTHGGRDLVDGSPLGAAQHRNNLVLL